MEENLVKETMPNLDKANNEGSDRPRSKSSPQLNNGAPVVTNSTNGSSKKGRFTVTTAGVNSNSSSPSKSQNLTQEFPINPHPLSNGPVQFTSEIMSSTQFGLSSEARPHDEKIDVDSHASVGIALELKGNNQTPSAAKKPKSRFTVKTISLEVSFEENSQTHLSRMKKIIKKSISKQWDRYLLSLIQIHRLRQYLKDFLGLQCIPSQRVYQISPPSPKRLK